MKLTIANLGGVDSDEFTAAVAAVLKQVTLDFQPEWRGNATIIGTSIDMTDDTVNIDAPSDAIIYVGDKCEDETRGIGGVRGYHSKNHAGIPYGFVYLDVCEQSGHHWTTTLSHEILEMLADPTNVCNILGPSPKNDGTKVYFGLEVCDATQGDTYTIDGVLVSNFVYKAYYQIPGGQPYTNHLRLTLNAFGMRPGGYLQFDQGGAIQEVNGDRVTQKKKSARKLLSGHRRNDRRAQLLTADFTIATGSEVNGRAATAVRDLSSSTNQTKGIMGYDNDVETKGKGQAQRWLWLWLMVVAIDVIGFKYLDMKYGFTDRAHHHRPQFLFLGLLSTALIAAPLIRFLSHGWQDRYEEFRNRLTDGALFAYLKQFWEPRARRVATDFFPDQTTTGNLKRANDLFDLIYREQYGQSAFVMPFFLLLVAVLAQSFLVLMIGMEGYKLGESNDPNVSIAAIAGAYLFAFTDMVVNVRRKCLNVSDVYLYALRMLLAVPIGVAAAAAAPKGMEAAIAFGLGTFPIDTLTKVIRRLTGKPLNVTENDQAPDLIKLQGVTVPIASALSAEGVDSLQQLLSIDPILLAIRTGLGFKFVLQLGAQAVVRRYMNDRTDYLVPVGMADAQRIAEIVSMISSSDPGQQARGKTMLELAVTSLNTGANPPIYTSPAVQEIFIAIKQDSYTKFLMSDL